MKLRTLGFCLAATLLAAVASLAGDFSGRWQGKLSVNGDETPGYLVLKQDGQQLTGTAGPDAQKQVRLDKGMVEGDQATIEASPGSSVLKFVLRLKDDKLEGDVFEDGNKIGTATFLRSKESRLRWLRAVPSVAGDSPAGLRPSAEIPR
jgi:hypothetical protein